MLSNEWHKSTKCDNSGPNCLEVRLHDGMIEVRDSKNPNVAVLRLTNSEWDEFILGAKDGEFDL